MNKKKLFREFFIYCLLLGCIYLTAGASSKAIIFWLIVSFTYIYIINFFDKDKNIMDYLIQPKGENPFLDNYFDVDNHYSEGMIVYNLISNTYTKNGKDWEYIEENHL